MQFLVNDACIGCGLCEGTCPAVFSMTEEGKAQAVDGEVPAAAEDTAVAAMESCPVNAIEQR